ncbi:MAG: UDP-N-acetylmuramoyl-L-alanine--D-glutamate ligase [Clostridia bacterium]|nr:UDP-N-acetylmuramoyl-L-alanine--D-glutamate ligase [Clostridia bacterium]
MTYKEYFSKLNHKKINVIGAGVSNTPLIKMLVKSGAKVTVCDKKEDLGNLGKELTELGVKLNLGNSYLDRLDGEIIFRSPGIRPDIPSFLKAKENGALITSEMEVFFDLCPCKIIAVTGSDGKTTTTTLISELLKAAGYTVHIGGNIGKPLLPEIADIKEDHIVVLELSSFQLFTIKKSPHIAVITNLEPNHLNWHTDYKEYVDAKKNIMLHQGENDILVTNAANEDSIAVEKEAKGISRTFSRKVNCLCCLDGDYITYNGEKILDSRDILLPGVHNIENYMTAICAVYDFINKDIVKKVATTFEGVKHRIEFVREVDGVKYYNDSIASSPSRAIAGLNSFNQKIIMIAGGLDKKVPYDVLGPIICDKVKTLVLLGNGAYDAAAPQIKKAVESSEEFKNSGIEIKETSVLKDAVMAAKESAKEGDIVILCPAATSFDMFTNFEQRGNKFKDLVNEL